MNRIGDDEAFEFNAIDNLIVFDVDKPNDEGTYERTHFFPLDTNEI